MEKNERVIVELCNGIEDEKIRLNVINYLSDDVDELFFIAPASRSFHPVDERGKGGLITHTKRVKLIVKLLCDANKISGREKDILIAAAVVHDTAKYGLKEDGSLEYYVNHSDLVKDVGLMPEIVEIAKMHMGPWYREDRWKRSCEHGKLLYYADYLASREELRIDV